jgi:predicted nucleotidyltransferase
MPKEMNIQNVSNDVRAMLSLNPGLVKKAGIFGSLARGDFNEKSDIDLMLWYDSPQVFSMDKITKYCELCAKIEDKLVRLYARNVDIADIEDDSLK